MTLRVIDGQASGKPPLRTRLGRELRRHWIGYSVLAVFAAAGAILTPWFLPGASPYAGAFGGFALGVYAALCAVPDRFLDD